MNRQKKPFRFYLMIFIFSSVIIAGYSLYSILANETPVSDIYPIWFMPLLFTLFYWGSDVLILRLSKRRKKKVSGKAKFLDDISEKMRNSEEFLIEDYRKLQNNSKFQEDLERAFSIFENGENEVFTIAKLENKYRKNTVEKRAMKYVVDYLKENPKLLETE